MAIRLILLTPTRCRVGEGLLAGQQDPELAAVLNAALMRLVTDNDLTKGLDRVNISRFRTNLQHFVTDARSILRRK